MIFHVNNRKVNIDDKLLKIHENIYVINEIPSQ